MRYEAEYYKKNNFTVTKILKTQIHGTFQNRNNYNLYKTT